MYNCIQVFYRNKRFYRKLVKLSRNFKMYQKISLNFFSSFKKKHTHRLSHRFFTGRDRRNASQLNPLCPHWMRCRHVVWVIYNGTDFCVLRDIFKNSSPHFFLTKYFPASSDCTGTTVIIWSSILFSACKRIKHSMWHVVCVRVCADFELDVMTRSK